MGSAFILPARTRTTMADLLLSLPARAYTAARDYDPFRSVSIQIPLSPLKACPFDPPGSPDSAEPIPPPTVRSRIANLYKEKSADFAVTTARRQPARQKGIAPGHVPVTATGEAGRRYTQMLLEGYKGGSEVAGNKYCTARLEGMRIADQAQVHIYEVLWADLAKPTNGVLKFFLGLFQVPAPSGQPEPRCARYRSGRGYDDGVARIPALSAVRDPAAADLRSAASASAADCVRKRSQHGPPTRGTTKPCRWRWELSRVCSSGSSLSSRSRTRSPIGPWLWSLLAVMPALAGIAIPWGFMAWLRHCYSLSRLPIAPM